MQKIVPFLWFDSQAEEAANYYISVFREGRILKVARYGDAGSSCAISATPLARPRMPGGRWRYATGRGRNRPRRCSRRPAVTPC